MRKVVLLAVVAGVGFAAGWVTRADRPSRSNPVGAVTVIALDGGPEPKVAYRVYRVADHRGATDVGPRGEGAAVRFVLEHADGREVSLYAARVGP